MGRRDELRVGGQRLRIGSWRGSQQVGLVTPLSGPVSPGPALVARACAALAAKGYREVLTGALAMDELDAFEACGFELRDSLHLLVLDLRGVPDAPPLPAGVSLRAARRGDRRAALGVDTRAFPPFWRLDGPGLADAVTATPDARFRVARAGRQVVGYAVTGRAGTTGYLQRLAVDPAVEGRGIGRVLVVDGVQWVRRGGGTQVVVNTQVDNNRALDLYRSVGFELLPSGLRVLGRSLAGDDPAVDRAAVDDREGADGAGPGHR